MKPLVLVTLLLCASQGWAGMVDVRFEQVDRYADAGHGAQADEDRQLLAQHLQALGQHVLPAQQTLRITITDIDLAGRVPPAAIGFSDLRVLDGRADWPQITLRYRLDDGGRVLREGEDRLSDLNYLAHPNLHDANQRLPYERRMLSEWFRSRFSPDVAR